LEDDMQLRASIGQTVVRPDLREVSSATYLDPLTNFPIAGTPGVSTTDIINYDLRWEWYREAGNNLSVGLFYKDMEAPIESVQSPARMAHRLFVLLMLNLVKFTGLKLSSFKT
ncbi:TonB-dependent receptor, partial [marine sediment metagenome]